MDVISLPYRRLYGAGRSMQSNGGQKALHPRGVSRTDLRRAARGARGVPLHIRGGVYLSVHQDHSHDIFGAKWIVDYIQ